MTALAQIRIDAAFDTLPALPPTTDPSGDLLAAAEALSVLAAEQSRLGRPGRQAEALAWRATTLRVHAEIEATVETTRRAHSAAHLARSAADAACEEAGSAPLGREARARAILEVGLTALALAAADRSEAGPGRLLSAAETLDEARGLLTAQARLVEARRAELAAIEARARARLRVA